MALYRTSPPGNYCPEGFAHFVVELSIVQF